MIKITRKIMTNNNCYKAGKKITPKGIVFHTTASPNVMAGDWYSRWNNGTVDLGVHFFVDDVSIYQYLPCEKGDVHRGWHVGNGTKGTYNSSHISIEMCEPTDKFNKKEYFEKAYANMVDLCTYLCKEFNLSASTIVGHCEAHLLGYASNHADPNHYIPKMGKTLDGFRAEVKGRLTGKDTAPTVPTVSTTLKKGDKGVAVKTLQDNLITLGYKLEADGDFGNDTDTIVRKFQKANGLTMDGIVGKGTQAKITEALAVIKEKEEALKKIYRVRLSAKDVENQLGAFTDLEKAKALADANPKYAVYDVNGKLIYKYTVPTNTVKTVEERVTALEKTVTELLVKINKLEK